MKTGIYKLENKVNGKVYIGRGVNVFNRRSSHFSKLRKGTHRNIYLQRSFNKHGELCFKFSVIIKCFEEELNRLETYYIAFYRETLGKRNVYNMTDGGDGSVGYKHSKEIREKMSFVKRAMKHGVGTIHSKETKEKMSVASLGSKNPMFGKPAPNRRGVLQIDKNTGEIINEFESITNASVVTNIPITLISRVCRGKAKTTGGFKWTYL